MSKFKCHGCITFKETRAILDELTERNKGAIISRCEVCKRYKVQTLKEFTK